MKGENPPVPVSFRNSPNPAKPHLRFRPWPEHAVIYLPYGWVVQFCGNRELNQAATAWATRWNYAHRNEPAPGVRTHERFG